MTIHIKEKNKGKFNALKKRTGKSTEQLTHSKNPLTRKRAIFAQNAKKWKHELGGEVDYTGMGIDFMNNWNNPDFRKQIYSKTVPYTGSKYITGTVPTPGFKINPNAFYRGIGKEGFEDLVLNRVVRSKKINAYPEPYFSKGKLGEAYSKGYALELLEEPMKGVGAFKTGDLIQTPVNVVKAGNKNLKVYKQLEDKTWVNIPEYKNGGTVTKEKSKLNVENNNWIPITERNFYDRAILPYNDTLTLKQYYATPPQERIKYIPNNKFKIVQGKKGSTANQGSMQYFHDEPIPYGPKNSLNMTPTEVIPEYNLGGAISGVGGLLGVIPTPFTQVAGAAVGLLGGILSGNEQRKMQERARVAQVDSNIGMANEMLLGNKTGSTFAYGGLQMGSKPIEVEGGEVMQNPRGTVRKIQGPSHAKGGVDIMAQIGSKVYSDKLINPKTGNTFAQDADIIRKKLQRYGN